MSYLQITGRKITLLAIAVLLAGCAVGSPATPAAQSSTLDLDAVRTEAAQTVVAKITQDAASNPSATPIIPTQTLPPVVTSTSAAPVPSLTPLPPQATATKKSVVVYPTWTRTPYTDAAEFVKQNLQDGFVFGPGGDFDIVWTVKNVGLRPWNNEFYIRYLSGVKGSKATLYMLPGAVNVNDTVDLRVDMIAPYETGNYSTVWQLINNDGVAIQTLYFSFSVR